VQRQYTRLGHPMRIEGNLNRNGCYQILADFLCNGSFDRYRSIAGAASTRCLLALGFHHAITRHIYYSCK
jgi:hypothetical protein